MCRAYTVIAHLRSAGSARGCHHPMRPRCAHTNGVTENSASATRQPSSTPSPTPQTADSRQRRATPHNPIRTTCPAEGAWGCRPTPQPCASQMRYCPGAPTIVAERLHHPHHRRHRRRLTRASGASLPITPFARRAQRRAHGDAGLPHSHALRRCATDQAH